MVCGCVILISVVSLGGKQYKYKSYKSQYKYLYLCTFQPRPICMYVPVDLCYLFMLPHF